MREQSSEEADEWNYESEWESEEVCELMSEDLNQYVSEKVNYLIEWLIELRCVDVVLNWGEVSEWKGESERANEWLWCMGAENDHFVNVRSSLDRMLTAQFDQLEVSLAWNCMEYVFADQLSSAIIHHDLIWYDVIWFQVWIWFGHPYVCTSYVCHFSDNSLPVNIITVH